MLFTLLLTRTLKPQWLMSAQFSERYQSQIEGRQAAGEIPAPKDMIIR